MPPLYELHRNFAKMFSSGKTRMIGLPYAEESIMIMLSHFDRIPERNRRTDRRTELLNIARQLLCWCAVKLTMKGK